MNRYRVVSLEERYRWPSGKSRSAALFATTPEAVTLRSGVPFRAGVDDLDYFRDAGLELPSGRHVWLVWYERAPVLGLDLQIDDADDSSAARVETMTALDLTASDIIWIPEVDSPAR